MFLPKTVYNLIKAFFILLFLGILFANGILVIMALILLLLAIMGSYLKLPSEIRVERTCSAAYAYTGELIHVSLEVWVEAGTGIVMISDALPANFEVIKGSNFKMFWKGSEKRKETVNYAMRCSLSGSYCLEKVQWEVRHCLFKQMRQGEEACKSAIEIRPLSLEVQKIRNAATVARIPVPIGSETRIGISTMEFKEMRLYSYGDSFRGINWKATARNIYRGSQWPIINEYEKEGKKEVWLYMDLDLDMEFGRNTRNAYECGLEAANGLAEYYLKQNCSVAFHTYNGRSTFIAPGSGEKHHYRIVKELVGLNREDDEEQGWIGGLEEAVSECRNCFAGKKPLFIIITRQSGNQPEELSEGIREISKYAGIRNGRLQVMVINISGYDLAVQDEADRAAAKLLEARDEILYRSLKGKCIWVDWNPEKTSLLHALLKQGVGV